MEVLRQEALKVSTQILVVQESCCAVQLIFSVFLAKSWTFTMQLDPFVWQASSVQVLLNRCAVLPCQIYPHTNFCVWRWIERRKMACSGVTEHSVINLCMKYPSLIFVCKYQRKSITVLRTFQQCQMRNIAHRRLITLLMSIKSQKNRLSRTKTVSSLMQIRTYSSSIRWRYGIA